MFPDIISNPNTQHRQRWSFFLTKLLKRENLRKFLRNFLFYFQETEEEESEKGMSGHSLGWRCNICFSGFRRSDFSCFLFLLPFFNLNVLAVGLATIHRH